MSESESERRPNVKKNTISPWIPVSMLAITTAALALPLALLRRRRASPSTLSSHTSPSYLTSPPPVRRASTRRIALTQTLPTSTAGTPSTKAGALFRGPSEAASRVSKEDGFNGALYSLKAFSIATALVVAGGAASVWGVKAYLGIKDTQEFASAMRLTLLNKWPLLTSRIHRASGDTPTPIPPWPPASEPPDSSPPTNSVPGVMVDNTESQWSWPAAQERLAAAYERGGVAQFAEAVVDELEAELELERRKRELRGSIEGKR